MNRTKFGTIVALVLVVIFLLSSYAPDRQRQLRSRAPSAAWMTTNVRIFLDPLNRHIQGVPDDSIWAGTEIMLPPTLTVRTLRHGSNLGSLWKEWQREVKAAILFKEEKSKYFTDGTGVIIVSYRPDTTKNGRVIVTTFHAQPLTGFNERQILSRFGNKSLTRAVADSIHAVALREFENSHSDAWYWVLLGIAFSSILILGYLLNRKSVIVNDIIDTVAPALRGKHKSQEDLSESLITALQKSARLCGLSTSANERPVVTVLAMGNGRK